jgi:hypothetical protein
MDGQEIGVQFSAMAKVFIFSTGSRSALGPTRPLIQWASQAISLGVTRPERESGLSPSSATGVKSVWSYTATPPQAQLSSCSCFTRAASAVQDLVLCRVANGSRVIVEKLTVAQFIKKCHHFMGNLQYCHWPLSPMNPVHTLQDNYF